MEQHPVPQHIASFQFKLFGNLTVRQFSMLALPSVLAGFIFFSALQPTILKYFLAGAIGLGGAFVALVPVGGRPFDKWLVAFIRAIFSPTQRIWIKETQLPEFLSIVIAPPRRDEKIPEEITAVGRERLVAYLKSLPKDNQSPLDTRESMAVSQLDFESPVAGTAGVSAPIIWPSEIEQTQPKIISPTAKSENFPKQGDISGINLGKSPTIAPFADKPQEVKIKKVEAVPVSVEPFVPKQAVKIQHHAKPFSLQGIEDRLNAKPQASKPKKPQTEHLEVMTRPRLRAHLASDGNFAVDNIISLIEPDNHLRFVRGVGKTRVRKLHFAPPANFDLSKLPIRGERRFEISEELKKRFNFEDDTPSVILPNEKSVVDNQTSFDVGAAGSDIAQILPKREVKTPTQPEAEQPKTEPKVEANKQVPQLDPSKFSVTDTKHHVDFQQNQGPEIIPLTSTPNVLSGLVADSTGVPIESAVLVVRDTSGIPVRALKTNKLGQFLSATPLPNGHYTAEVESDAAVFKPMEFNLSGQVLPPLGLKGDAKAN